MYLCKLPLQVSFSRRWHINMKTYRNEVTEGDFKVQNIMAGKTPIIVARIKACDSDNGCVIRCY